MKCFHYAAVPVLVALTLLTACAPAGPAAPAAPTASALTSAPSPAAATPAPAATVPVPTTAAATEAQIKVGIQETLDRYAQAWGDNDLALLDETIDPQSGAFRRLVKGRFETFQESALRGQYVFSFTVDAITPLEYDFVRATVRTGGSTMSWTFREVDNRWLLSEPSATQVGKRETHDTEHFTFQTYPWSDSVNSEVMELMEQARDVVVERLGRSPEKQARVSILPASTVGPPQGSGTVAYYISSPRPTAPDQIIIYAPYTFAFGDYNATEGWQPFLRRTLTHEYTHLVQNRSFTPIVRVPLWMSEGLAEYVSDSPRANEVRQAIENDAVIPLIDPTTTDPLKVQDLQHMGALERDSSLAYGLSYSLVAYIVEKHGGLDGFWKLAEAYDKRQKLPAALEQAFNISYEDFDTGWRTWLRETYTR